MSAGEFGDSPKGPKNVGTENPEPSLQFKPEIRAHIAMRLHEVLSELETKESLQFPKWEDVHAAIFNDLQKAGIREEDAEADLALHKAIDDLQKLNLLTREDLQDIVAEARSYFAE